MWSSDRRRALRLGAAGLIPLLLGGCFRPMLAEGTTSSALLGDIALPSFDDRFGYYLNESLEERLGAPASPKYRLEVKTKLRREDLAITQDNAVTRISLTAIADWSLYREGSTDPVLKDRTVSQSGYNSTASLFATREVKLDVERRLARDLGERISRSLLARADSISQAGS